MDSPLKYDEAIVKEFGIDKSIEIDPVYKLGFVRAQLEEIGKLLWRTRTELIMAEAQTASDIEAIAADAKTKVAAHRNTIKGVIMSLRVLVKLKDELEKVVPNEPTPAAG